MRAALAEGRLPLGSRLPPTRSPAAELPVSRGGVTEIDRRPADEATSPATAGPARW